MAGHNRDIAAQFSRLADLLEPEDGNPFRVRAYRNAARTVGAHSRDMAEMLEQNEDLSRLPGIGKDLAGKIRQIVETGHLPLLDTVEQRTPAALHDLMRIEGLGPKRMKTLYNELGIQSLDALKQAVDAQQPHRHAEGRCPRCGEPVATTRVAGRTACFCPHCQPH